MPFEIKKHQWWSLDRPPATPRLYLCSPVGATVNDSFLKKQVKSVSGRHLFPFHLLHKQQMKPSVHNQSVFILKKCVQACHMLHLTCSAFLSLIALHSVITDGIRKAKVEKASGRLYTYTVDTRLKKPPVCRWTIWVDKSLMLLNQTAVTA